MITNRIAELEISIGIAEPAENMASIETHYQHAAIAVNTGRKVWPQLKIYHYLDLGAYQLLSCLGEENQVAGFVERTLGKLLQYDKRKRGSYLETLEIILMSDNLKGSANNLSIHYHTLMFRKKRMEEILEVSLDDFSSRMAILTALHLLKIR